MLKFKKLKQDNLGAKHDFGGWEIEIAKIVWDQNFLLWSQFVSKIIMILINFSSQ